MRTAGKNDIGNGRVQGSWLVGVSSAAGKRQNGPVVYLRSVVIEHVGIPFGEPAVDTLPDTVFSF